MAEFGTLFDFLKVTPLKTREVTEKDGVLRNTTIGVTFFSLFRREPSPWLDLHFLHAYDSKYSPRMKIFLQNPYFCVFRTQFIL